MKKITGFVITDILKNKIILMYTLVLAVFAWSVFSLEDNTAKGVLSLLNVILLTVPLVSIIFSNIYMYNSSEFIELLVSQPIQRKTIWLSLFTGLVVSMNMAFIIGVGIPVFILLYRVLPACLSLLQVCRLPQYLYLLPCFVQYCQEIKCGELEFPL